MRVILVLLLAYVAVAYNDARADCVLYKPDGRELECPPSYAPPAETPPFAQLCTLGVMVAHRAYLVGTFDAKFPDRRKLHYLVDYYGDLLTVKHDRASAERAVDYIAVRLRDMGIRRPTDMVAYTAAQEFMSRECNK